MILEVKKFGDNVTEFIGKKCYFGDSISHINKALENDEYYLLEGVNTNSTVNHHFKSSKRSKGLKKSSFGLLLLRSTVKPEVEPYTTVKEVIDNIGNVGDVILLKSNGIADYYTIASISIVNEITLTLTNLNDPDNKQSMCCNLSELCKQFTIEKNGKFVPIGI